MRKVFALLLAAALIAPASAHDVWLQPKGFQFPTPGTVPMLIFVGHGKDRQRYGAAIEHVVQFRSQGAGGPTDRIGELTFGDPAHDGLLHLTQPGTYLFAFQSKATASILPYLRFNDYIALEGLTPAQDYRKQTGQERADGREFYSRRAKAIVQVGPIDPAAAKFVTRPLGFSLEIVPEQHPNLLKDGELLPVRILFEGKPLPGALVKLTNLDFDTRPVEEHRSDANGRASFAVPRHGAWLVNVIWTKPIKGNPDADFQTIFSSLTFGY